MTAADPAAAAAIRDRLLGVRVALSISVAAALGIPDELADGPRSAPDVATALGCDPEAMYRLLRTLAALGVLHEEDDRLFSLTGLGVALRSDVEGSVRDQAILFGRPSTGSSSTSPRGSRCGPAIRSRFGAVRSVEIGSIRCSPQFGTLGSSVQLIAVGTITGWRGDVEACPLPRPPEHAESTGETDPLRTSRRSGGACEGREHATAQDFSRPG